MSEAAVKNSKGAFVFSGITFVIQGESYSIRPSHHDQTKVWIENKEGEGGEFPAGDIYHLIDEYFKEHF